MLLGDFHISSIQSFAAMGSPRAEEQKDESTGINPQRVDDTEEAGKQGAGTSLADEKQVNPREVAAPNPTPVQQRGAGDQPKNERVAEERRLAEARRVTDVVFGTIEKKLKEQDESERLLAEAYRDSQKRHKKKTRERLGHSGVEADQDTNANDSDPDSCYIKIRNLVLIEDSTIHKKALEEWDREQKFFAERVQWNSTKVESQKNEVYQLIGFFSVFQGVVLTAVSQSSLLHCNNRWSPIFLSLLASFVTIAAVSQKLKQISSLEGTIFSDTQAGKVAEERSTNLRREGKDFVFAQFSEDKMKKSKGCFSKMYALSVIVFILIFSAAFPVSHSRILCHPGRNPYGGAPSPT